MEDDGDGFLEDFFAAARAAPPPLPPGLAARVAAEGARLQPRPAPAVRRGAPGLGRRLAAALLGGGGALAGLTGAAAAGVAIGLAQPLAVQSVGARLWPGAGEVVELYPDLEAVLLAGGTEMEDGDG